MTLDRAPAVALALLLVALAIAPSAAAESGGCEVPAAASSIDEAQRAADCAVDLAQRVAHRAYCRLACP